tara:strand:+ start:48 stop:764 length:717 start_codon:yes stop_codon:yes gene_type:complete
MKKYKPKIIAEIGLNYIGNKKILQQYIDKLAKSDVDGISLQVLRKNFYKGKFENYFLDDEILTNFVIRSKKKFKYVGIASDNLSSISKLKKHGINFVKILSKDINDLKLIKHCINENFKDIFISTGFSPSIKSLKILLKKIDSTNVSLIHTNLKNDDLRINLHEILKLKREFNLPISYGNHSKYLETISNSVFYLPYSIFFYVKLNRKNIIFPDNKHAVTLNNVNNIIKNIYKNIKTI